eukprot:14245376-Heterocapsa_arctica.AAC.1
MEEDIILLAQAMYNSVALIDMANGGDRPITLLSMLLRLLIRARGSYITKSEGWGWARLEALLGSL